MRTTFKRTQSTKARRATPTSVPKVIETLEVRQVLTSVVYPLTGDTVVYHGGSLLSHVEVSSVYFGPVGQSPATSQIDGFLSSVVGSAYMTQLHEYSAGSFQIGHGSFDGHDITSTDWTTTTVTIGGTSYTAVDDSTIRAMLKDEILNTHLQSPDANRLYIVYTPANVVVTAGTSNSRQNFLGYHNTFMDGAGHSIRYAVIPNPTGNNSVANSIHNVAPTNPVDTQTVVSSHELAEAVTDPDLNAWYSNTTGNEIADIVNQVWDYRRINKVKYAVQFLWSQRLQAGLLLYNPTGSDFNGDGISDVGIYQPNNDFFALAVLDGHNHIPSQEVFNYGFHNGGVNAIPLTGDFNGDGITDVGIYQPNHDLFALAFLDGQGHITGQEIFNYGFHNGGVDAVPLVGDFNGDGISDVGIYQPNNDFFALAVLDGQNHVIGQEIFNYGFHNGGVNAVPLVGDFNGDGISDVGIYQPNNDFFALAVLDGQNHIPSQEIFNYGFHNGGVNAVPLVGDFNGDGISDVGIYQPNNDFFALAVLDGQNHIPSQEIFNYGFHNGGVNAVPLPSSTLTSSGGGGLSARARVVPAVSPQIVLVPPAQGPATAPTPLVTITPFSASETGVVHDLAIASLVKGSNNRRS